MKKIISFLLFYFAKELSYIYSYKFYKCSFRLINKLYSGWVSREFKGFGRDSVVQRHLYLLGGKYISIGNKSCIGLRAILTAWDKYGSDRFHPEIIIGNHVSIGEDSHITAINRIEIGNNVLIGKKVTITDNSHGKSNFELLPFSPSTRPLHSEGPVIIENGVWIGDKATILPNVRIGENAIIGANAVVTKDIPANCVASGIPAKVIKIIE
jgi:acetyltransferase-like isoleucine patch superfamily enzyme